MFLDFEVQKVRQVFFVNYNDLILQKGKSSLGNEGWNRLTAVLNFGIF